MAIVPGLKLPLFIAITKNIFCFLTPGLPQHSESGGNSAMSGNDATRWLWVRFNAQTRRQAAIHMDPPLELRHELRSAVGLSPGFSKLSCLGLRVAYGRFFGTGLAAASLMSAKTLVTTPRRSISPTMHPTVASLTAKPCFRRIGPSFAEAEQTRHGACLNGRSGRLHASERIAGTKSRDTVRLLAGAPGEMREACLRRPGGTDPARPHPARYFAGADAKHPGPDARPVDDRRRFDTNGDRGLGASGSQSKQERVLPPRHMQPLSSSPRYDRKQAPVK